MAIARLFRNGKSQAVRLPKAFQFSGDRVFIKQQGKAVILLPYHEPWQALFDSLEQFSPDFMEQREQPAQQAREDLFE